jgi:hypothetical protein
VILETDAPNFTALAVAKIHLLEDYDTAGYHKLAFNPYSSRLYLANRNKKFLSVFDNFFGDFKGFIYNIPLTSKVRDIKAMQTYNYVALINKDK